MAMHDHVDHAVLLEILRALETFRQLFADRLLDHTRTGKADQRAEYLKEHGMVDMVVHRHDLRRTLARLCRLLTKSPALEGTAKSTQPVTSAAQIVSAPEVAPAAPHA